jgi:hypothetical protein
MTDTPDGAVDDAIANKVSPTTKFTGFAGSRS